MSEKEISEARARGVRCSKCGGAGTIGDEKRPCEACGGEGWILPETRPIAHGVAEEKARQADADRRLGAIEEGDAPTCHVGCAIAAEYHCASHGGACDARPEAERVAAIKRHVDAGLSDAEIAAATEREAKESFGAPTIEELSAPSTLANHGRPDGSALVARCRERAKVVRQIAEADSAGEYNRFVDLCDTANEHEADVSALCDLAETRGQELERREEDRRREEIGAGVMRHFLEAPLVPDVDIDLDEARRLAREARAHEAELSDDGPSWDDPRKSVSWYEDLDEVRRDVGALAALVERLVDAVETERRERAKDRRAFEEALAGLQGDKTKLAEDLAAARVENERMRHVVDEANWQNDHGQLGHALREKIAAYRAAKGASS